MHGQKCRPMKFKMLHIKMSSFAFQSTSRNECTKPSRSKTSRIRNANFSKHYFYYDVTTPTFTDTHRDPNLHDAFQKTQHKNTKRTTRNESPEFNAGTPARSQNSSGTATKLARRDSPFCITHQFKNRRYRIGEVRVDDVSVRGCRMLL